MAYKPVGVDENSNFPPRVEAHLSDKIGAETSALVPPLVADYIASEPAVVDAAAAAAGPAVAEELDEQIGDALVSANAVLGISVRRIIAAPLGSTPTAADGDLVMYYDQPGANYFTDFRTTAAGAAPTGWTQVWGTTNWTVQNVADATGGKALVVHPSAQSTMEYALAMDAVNADAHRGDAEVLMRFRSTGTSRLLGAFMRLRGIAGSNDANTGGFGWRMAYNNDTDLRIGRYTFGSYSAGSSGSGLAVPASTANTWYLIRARIEGNTMKLKSWKDGDPEPAWMAQETSALVPEPGAIGIMLSRYGNLAPQQIDWIAIATGGRTAVAQ